MKNLFAVFMASLAGVLCVNAVEDKPIQDLGLTFPLEVREGKVFLNQSVLLNENFIAPEGTWFRVIFLPPEADDADVKKHVNRVRNNPALSRQPNETKLRKDDSMTPQERAARDRALNTIWKEGVSFRSALERWDPFKMRFVFQLQDNDEVRIVPLRLVEDMLLGEKDGHITVLTLRSGSSAEKAGFDQGTELVELNGRGLKGDLEVLRAIYLEEREKKQQTDRNLVFTVRQPGSQKTETLTLKLPLSLGTSFWEVIE